MSGQTDPGVQRFIGNLGMTNTVQFGGSPYCNYSVTLKNVVLDVTLHPTHGLTTMSVADTMVEATDMACPFPPAAMSRQFFAHDGGPQLANGSGSFVPVLDGQSTNAPMTAATVVVTPMNPNVIVSTVRWERTDQGPPLKWVVMPSVAIALQRVTCETNDLYCLGDGAIGALYGCTDGLNLAEIKHCAAGCAPPSPLMMGQHVDESCN
jgi:hypothetical protein